MYYIIADRTSVQNLFFLSANSLSFSQEIFRKMEAVVCQREVLSGEKLPNGKGFCTLRSHQSAQIY